MYKLYAITRIDSSGRKVKGSHLYMPLYVCVGCTERVCVCVFVRVCENAIQQVAAAVSSNRDLIQATQQP